MSRCSLLLLITVILLATSCGGMHQPTLEEDFIDTTDYELRECASDTIKAIEKTMMSSRNDPELYRRLAVCLRAQGTPESRLRSQEAIDKALELDPENPVYHVERGLTLYARQFTGDACSSLDHAVELDPGCFQAWYHKGRIEKDLYLRNMCSDRNLDNAIRYFRKANNIYGKHEETLFSLGLLQYLRERHDIASRCAQSGIGLFPEEPGFRLLSGTVALEQEDFETAVAEFDSALALMDPVTKNMYEDLTLLQPMEDRQSYWNLGVKSRAEFNRKFWVMNDPTPATEINERLLEHYSRIFLSNALLTNDRLEILGIESARGRALVSYGLPPVMLLNIGSGVDGPFVVWSYIQGNQMFLLYFQDEFLNGNYHIPIDPKFYQYAMITEGILQNIPQMYDFPVEYERIPVAAEFVQFRGTLDNTRLDLAVALQDSVLDHTGGKYKLDFILFDNDWNVFLTKQITFDPAGLLRIAKPSGGWRILPFSLDLPPLQLESSFAFEITGGSPPGRAVYRSPLMIRDLTGGHLSLSGIRFALRNSDGKCTPLIDPLPSYGTGASLCVSYEIYNLKWGADNTAKYRVTWSVTSADQSDGPSSTWEWIAASVRGSEPEKQVYLSSSIEQSSNERSRSDGLMLDVSPLEPGRYRLILDIEDLVAGFKVSGSRSFAIIPRTGS